LQHVRERVFCSTFSLSLNIGHRCFAVVRDGFVDICLLLIATGLFPKLPSERQCIDIECLPPGHLIAGLMKLSMMTATKRDGELITDFETDGFGLRKAQMVRIGWSAPANQTGLRGHKFQVGFVAQALGLSDGAQLPSQSRK